MKRCIGILLIALCCLCFSFHKKENSRQTATQFIQVLGIAQDAGYPQMGCTKACCKNTGTVMKPKTCFLFSIG